MKVENDAVLTCSNCGIEGPHELLYLSEHLCASRCGNCGKTQVYSGHIYAEYARDLVERTGRLPGKFAGEVLRHPTRLVTLPIRALGKPLGVMREVGQVTAFERGRRSHPSGRRT